MFETEANTSGSDQTERSHLQRQVEPLCPEPQKLTEKDQRELILKAIDEKYRTFVGIQKRVGFPTWYPMDGILAGMIIDYVLRREDKGDVTAYFRYKTKPLNFWRIGDGQIEAEFDQGFVPRDEAAKAEELGDFTRKLLYPTGKPGASTLDDEIEDFDPDQDDAPIARPTSPFTERVSQNAGTPKVKKNARPPSRGSYRKASPIDRTHLQRFSETEPNTKSIAAKLGISQSHLYKEFDKDPNLRDIYDRGRRKFATSQGHAVEDIGGRPRKAVKRPATPQERPISGKGPDLDVDEVERVAREGFTIKDAAEHFGMTMFVFKNRLNAKKGPMKPIRDAWYRGKGSSVPTSTVSNKSKPAGNAVRRSVKEPVRAKQPEPEVEKTTAEILETGRAIADDIVKEALSMTLSFLGPEGKPVILHELAENLGFNVGNALMHVANDEIEAAVWYLEREKTRRERAHV